MCQRAPEWVVQDPASGSHEFLLITVQRGAFEWNTGPLPITTPTATLRRMKMLRRMIVALSMAGAIAGVLRVRGKGGVPPQVGGWREIDVPAK